MKQERALVGDQRRIVGVDRVGITVRSRLGEDNLGARRFEQRAKGLVLAGDPGRVGLGRPSARSPAMEVLGARRPHEHAP